MTPNFISSYQTKVQSFRQHLIFFMIYSPLVTFDESLYLRWGVPTAKQLCNKKWYTEKSLQRTVLTKNVFTINISHGQAFSCQIFYTVNLLTLINLTAKRFPSKNPRAAKVPDRTSIFHYDKCTPFCIIFYRYIMRKYEI